MKALSWFFAIFFGFSFSACAVAQDQSIEAVTVYPDRAEVTRLIQIELAGGEDELLIDQLPMQLVPDSVQLAVRSGPDVVLGGMALRTVRGAEQVQPRARELEERIRSLELRIQALTNRIDARDLQMRLLESIASGDSGQDADDWLSTMESLGVRAEEVLAQRLAHETERSDHERELARLQHELGDLGQSLRDTRELRVPVVSDSSGEAEIELRYAVLDAGWEAVYEWRLDTEAGQLKLVQQARVRQQTGEDWGDVKLSVALGRPALGGQLPQLRPWFIDIAGPEVRARAMESTAADAVSLMSAPAPVLEGSEMAASYRVPGRSSLSGDGVSRRFMLAEHELDGALSVRAVPRLQPRAWLYFEGGYDGEAWLPPGSASLFQDGAAVGQTRFDGLAPGSRLAASFGVADRVEISHRLVRDTRGSEGMVRRSNRLERAFEFEISNRYSRALEIVVVDQMPVPRDERIEVELVSEGRRPDERDYEDQSGVLAWRDEYAPDQTRRFRFGYRAVFPRDIEGLSGW